MKLTLDISKRFTNSPSGIKEQFIFSVIDLDRLEGYPANFVCLLPKELKSTSNSGKTKFIEVFGEDSNQIATRLLKNAFGSESDVELRREIEKRLKLL